MQQTRSCPEDLLRAELMLKLADDPWSLTHAERRDLSEAMASHQQDWLQRLRDLTEPPAVDESFPAFLLATVPFAHLVHGIDEQGKVVIRRKLRRGQVLKYFAKLQPCLIGMEACATAHHWARELRKLGHEVRLMPNRMSNATRTTLLTPKRFVRSWCVRPCGLYRSRRTSNNWC